MEILTKDFVEFIECCAAREVEFLVVGGYALAAHGHPRATKNLEADDFLEPEVIVQLGYPPMRIDLITSATGVDFDQCWDNRVVVPVGSVMAGFISREDLIANKVASARPQDLVDVDILRDLE